MASRPSLMIFDCCCKWRDCEAEVLGTPSHRAWTGQWVLQNEQSPDCEKKAYFAGGLRSDLEELKHYCAPWY